MRDLQHLFLRFGINAAVRAPIVAANDAAWVSHELEISGADDLPRLVGEIGILGQQAALEELVAHARGRGRARARRPRARSGVRVADAEPRSAATCAGTRSSPSSPTATSRSTTSPSPSLHNFVAGDVFVHNTSFALGMVAHAALEAARPVLFFSLEMSNLELSQRLLCAEARVDSTRVRNGQLQKDDWSKITHAMGRLAEAPIWIDDNPNLTIMEIRAKARRLKSQIGDLGMIVIDYLQLMTGRSGAENRQVEVSELSRGLKILARELETPVVALSQLSRGLEMRADKRPMLADLRESGSIEQDADVVMFIYREEVYDPKPENAGHGRDHRGQAPLRPHRRRPARLPPPVHPLRQHGPRLRLSCLLAPVGGAGGWTPPAGASASASGLRGMAKPHPCGPPLGRSSRRSSDPRRIARSQVARSVLFAQWSWDGIADGSITVTFRRWKQRQAIDRRHRTARRPGASRSTAVDIVTEAEMTEQDARASGYPSAAALLADLRGTPDLPIYRIRFRLGRWSRPAGRAGRAPTS